MQVTLPDGVTAIGDWAFSDCRSLTQVTIPDSVTAVGYGVFYDCTRLKQIILPASVSSIGEDAFENCNNLSITLKRNSYAEDYAIDNNIPYQYPVD